MKKLNIMLFLFFALAIGFTSCKKDPIKDPAKVTILGKWNFVSQIAKNYVNGELKGEVPDTTVGYVEFKSDGTLLAYDNGQLVAADVKYTISEDGKTLTLLTTENGQVTSESTQIKQLSSSNLVLYGEYTETSQGQVYKSTTETIFKR